MWDIRYEPHAMCWILMPETLRGLWRQRLRWARGGSEVLKKYTPVICSWRQRRIWPVYIEYSLSVCWAFGMTATLLMFLLGLVLPLPEPLRVQSILPGWTGTILSAACLMQMAVGLAVDSRYEPRIYRLFYWLIWYPAVYWILNAAVTLVGFPRAMARTPGRPAVWTSPDRGI
jgi:biofilm PGA synthesis N-glycosyltransferase PgaC